MKHPDGCAPVSRTTASGRCGRRESVEQRLRASGYLALRRIDCDCECEGGVVCLRGCVPSHYLKQVAQTIAAAVDGVRRVDNRIVVVAGGPRSS
jgi:osmotically-inducible protein OsmY